LDSHNSMRNVAQNAERYLSHYKVNVFALMILEEAILQFQESNSHAICNGVIDKQQLTSLDSKIIDSLEFIFDQYKACPPYKAKTDIEFVDEKIRIYQLKFRGYGMEYLRALSKTKNSYLYY
jgi:hypothetical protein